MREDNQSKKTLVEEAAEWIVLLSADDDVRKRTAQIEFDAWKSISPQRQKIARDIEQYLASIQKLVQTPQQQHVTQSVLKAGLHSARKQKAMRHGGIFAVIFCSLGGFYAYLIYHPISYLTADIKSDLGEWKTQILPDGSQLKLKGRSAVDLDFSEHERVVALLQGEMFIDVAKDPARPFIVKTAHGQIHALGTAFSVNYRPDATELKMLHSKVKVVSAYATKFKLATSPVIVKQGQQVTIDQYGIHPIHGFNVWSEQQKWNQRNLIVENMPLPKVLSELNRSSQGKIIFNPATLEHIKVNAVLPLDHTENALQLLNSVFPQLDVYHITPYLTVVTLK